MQVICLASKIGNFGCSDSTIKGGFSQIQFDEAESELQEQLQDLEENGFKVIDVKVNHFCTKRHNNGGSDEIWVQYTISYN